MWSLVSEERDIISISRVSSEKMCISLETFKIDIISLFPFIIDHIGTVQQ